MRLLLIIIMIIGLASEAPAFDSAAEVEYHKFTDYIGKLKSSRSAVFFAECKIPQGENIPRGGKVVMILPIGSTKGETIDLVDMRTDENDVVKFPVNWADMSLKNGKWSYDIYFGGEQTLRFESEVIEFLLKSNFKILKPSELDRIATSEPRLRCRFS